MTIRSKLPYIGAALSASAYAWWVESRPRKYHPDVTWPNVLGGVALTGAWVAVRVAQGVPPLDGPPWTYIRDERIRVAAWCWYTTFLMFWATGVPVVTWEELAKDGRYRALVAYLRGGHDQAAPAGKSGGRAG